MNYQLCNFGQIKEMNLLNLYSLWLKCPTSSVSVSIKGINKPRSGTRCKGAALSPFSTPDLNTALIQLFRLPAISSVLSLKGYVCSHHPCGFFQLRKLNSKALSQIQRQNLKSRKVEKVLVQGRALSTS